MFEPSLRDTHKRAPDWMRTAIRRDAAKRRNGITSSLGRVTFDAGIDAALDALAARGLLLRQSERRDV